MDEPWFDKEQLKGMHLLQRKMESKNGMPRSPSTLEEKYRTPSISELRVGQLVEILDQATTKLIKDIRWHVVEITANENEAGEYVAFNRLPRLILNKKIRVQIL
jgi:hypothetical protein